LHLLSYGINAAAGQTLTDACGIKDVFRRVMDELMARNSNPLMDFKMRGAINATGGIDWSLAVYEPDFQNQKLHAIKHRATGDVATTLAMQIVSSDYILDENWLGKSAHFQLAPFPKVKLEVFFAKKPAAGPWKNLPLAPKAFQEVCDKHFADWTNLRQSTSQASASSGNTLSALKVLDSDKRKASLEGGKLKAAETIAAKKKQRVVEFG
jgi:hypothetical protein